MGRKYNIGDVFYDRNNDPFTIVDKGTKRSYWIIEFADGHRKETRSDHITHAKYDLDGKQNQFVYGIGKIGNIRPKDHLSLYRRWRMMLRRCYVTSDPSYKNYGAKGVIVSDELKIFENYVKIVQQLDHYEDLIQNPKAWVIDKDLKSGQMKIYSADTLVIMKREENLALELLDHCQKVHQYTLDGEYVATYNSIKEAAAETGGRRNCISMALNGHIRSSGGYIWRRANEEI